ncbi:MAG: hypothetical protein IIZ27_04385 [Solobacterium sp.]|nr:hypothetical protein [Solobacterium sp.]
MKKILLVLLSLCMLGGCTKKQASPVPTRKPAYSSPAVNRPATTPGTTVKPTPTPLPDFEGELPPDFYVKEEYSEPKVIELMTKSALDWPSEIQKDTVYDKQRVRTYTLKWNLESTDELVYTCTVTVKTSYQGDETRAECSRGKGYTDYAEGDTQLKRYYKMPEPGEMFFPSRQYYYWESMLGSYSDMYSERTGKDSVRCEFFWYQDTEEGPVPVYTVFTDGYYVTFAEKSHPEIWEEYQVSAKNIHIISFDEYPHLEHAQDAYYDWKEANDRKSKQEEYCIYGDEEDLYEAYEDVFESLDEATDYWEEYCK